MPKPPLTQMTVEQRASELHAERSRLQDLLIKTMIRLDAIDCEMEDMLTEFFGG